MRMRISSFLRLSHLRFLLLNSSLCFVIALLSLKLPLVSSSFDPYQLNGGLVAAVAGRDYVLLATDTRLVGSGGYDILERTHLRSRLWSATSDHSFLHTTTTTTTKNDPKQGGEEAAALSSSIFGRDGSVQFPLQPPVSKTTDFLGEKEELKKNINISTVTSAPVLIASAGCQADCEMLKRVFRSDVRRSQQWGEVKAPGVNQQQQVLPSAIAVLLSQTLYQRRTFPWYAFCLVAGLSGPDEIGDESSDGCLGGQVFVYDAIGSYEAVAVATSGNGRNLLQPILDRSFSNNMNPCNDNSVDDSSLSGTTTMPMPTTYDRGGIAVAPFPRVQETAEQAAGILTRAYRAVSERDASVGDNLVLCCLQRRKLENGDTDIQCWSMSSPLKKH